jgi:hypothetical protein
MGASFPRYLDAIDYSNSMIQLWPITFEPSFDGSSPRGHAPERGRDEFHVLRHEGEEVVSPLVNNLVPAERHVARMKMVRRDLARMHGILHERRAYEHGRAVEVLERGLARPLDARERRAGHAQGDAVPGGGYRRSRHRSRHRRRGRGRVTWGKLVLLVRDIRIREGRLRIPRSRVTAPHLGRF